MKNTFFYIACFGFLYSLGGHLLSFSGAVPDPQIWILGAGIFVVWFPFILRVRRENPVPQQQDGWNTSFQRPRVSLNRLLVHAPKWMRFAAMGIFIYAIFNFIYVIATGESRTNRTELTSEDLRLFTGHFMAFYGIAAAGLFPEKQKVD